MKKFEYIIIGLGESGFSVAKYFISKNIHFAIVDNRKNPPKLAELKKQYKDTSLDIYTGDFEVDLQADTLVLSPGVDKDSFVGKYGSTKTVNDLWLFLQINKVPIVAITGTNGKSTVVELLHHVFKIAGIKSLLGGNIGIPAMNLLDKKDIEVIILEVSSFQLELIEKFQCYVGAILNVSHDHLDRHGSLDLYREIKQKAILNADNFIVNLEDTTSQPTSVDCIGNRIGISYSEPKNNQWGVRSYDDEKFIVHGKTKAIQISSLKLKGKHNIINALSVCAIADLFEISTQSLALGISSFLGLPHRVMLVGKHNGVEFINDSKATNVGATIAALSSLDEHKEKKIILLLGGDSKGVDLSILKDSILFHTKNCFVYGKDANKIIQQLGIKTSYKTMKEAFSQAVLSASAGDTVLLSPACSSLDQFSSFEDRGHKFGSFVGMLK